jgi:hypothetical protein
MVAFAGHRMMGVYDGEQHIHKLIGIMNDRGRNIPQTVDSFPDLPFEGFECLIGEIKNGGATICRFSTGMNSDIFQAVAAPHQKFINTAGLIVAYGGILAVIVTSYLVSWWLLILGPISFIIGSKITKKSYNEAIFTSAMYSEIIFCFMYYAGIVSIEAGDEYYYHKTD